MSSLSIAKVSKSQRVSVRGRGGGRFQPATLKRCLLACMCFWANAYGVVASSSERKLLEKELKEMKARGEDTYEIEERLGLL